MMNQRSDQQAMTSASREDSAQDHPEPDSGTPDGARDEPIYCASCGSEVPDGASSCPVCRRGAYRTCFCGWQLPATEATCPNCGSDWSQSARVARKSRSRTPRKSGMIRHAALGALTAVVVALIAWGLLSGFAALAGGYHEAAPDGIGERVGLALSGIARAAGQVGGFFARYAKTIGLFVGVVAVGAAAGLASYMLQRRNPTVHSRRSSRRVRRKRRQ